MRSGATMDGATLSWKVAVDTVIRARIDSATKAQAAEALAAMGLSVSDAIRLLMIRIAADRELPFPVKAPDASKLQT